MRLLDRRDHHPFLGRDVLGHRFAHQPAELRLPADQRRQVVAAQLQDGHRGHRMHGRMQARAGQHDRLPDRVSRRHAPHLDLAR
ncbi:hypothetical protein CFB34_034065, partial [Burkholderia sp. HI4860]|uniref:hypothetical protein n=1 Tax=Burkholderia sp. HI4860 TaxID=2015361 RepID=UPI001F6008D8